MRKLALLGILALAGCATSPLLPSAPTGNATSMRANSLASQAPFTRGDSGSPGTLYGDQLAFATIGKPGTYGHYRLTLQLAQGPEAVECDMIRPSSIQGIPQRYSNDCAQAALATTLNFLGANFGGLDPYSAIIQKMQPAGWGTRLEDVEAYMATHPELVTHPVRQASIQYLQQLVAEGKPVPVVLSMSATRMHYTVVVGTGVTASGQAIMVLKDPSVTDPSGFMALDQATFENDWQNQPIRTLVVDWVAGWIGHTNTDNYDRIAFDIGWPQ